MLRAATDRSTAKTRTVSRNRGQIAVVSSVIIGPSRPSESAQPVRPMSLHRSAETPHGTPPRGAVVGNLLVEVRVT